MYARADLPAVKVEGDFSRALKTFFKRWKSSGIKAELNFREQNPSKSARKRAKARRARRRWK